MPQPPSVQYDTKAYYRVKTDTVCIPRPESFSSAAAHYATLYHELTHSTGHPRRLGRFTIEDRPAFRSQDYSLEELVAEMGSAFLCAHAGIQQPVIENSASYISHWLQAFNNDRRMLIKAGTKAQAASDYIRNQPSDAEQPDESHGMTGEETGNQE